MHYEADTHTHTIASGHAYNTITEMVRSAADKGLKALAITDHTPGVPGHEFPGTMEEIYFRNTIVIPEELFGVRVLMGAEVNILNGGAIDLSERALRRQNIVIASIHGQCYEDEGIEKNTAAILKVLENPYVDILGHPDGSNWPLDYEQVIAKAAETGTIIELNENSDRDPGLRRNSRENRITYIALCKKYGVPVAIGSDAHFMDVVGQHEHNEKILEESSFPMELVMNTSADRLIDYLKSRKDRF